MTMWSKRDLLDILTMVINKTFAWSRYSQINYHMLINIIHCVTGVCVCVFMFNKKFMSHKIKRYDYKGIVCKYLFY